MSLPGTGHTAKVMEKEELQERFWHKKSLKSSLWLEAGGEGTGGADMGWSQGRGLRLVATLMPGERLSLPLMGSELELFLLRVTTSELLLCELGRARMGTGSLHHFGERLLPSPKEGKQYFYLQQIISLEHQGNTSCCMHSPGSALSGDPARSH